MKLRSLFVAISALAVLVIGSGLAQASPRW